MDRRIEPDDLTREQNRIVQRLLEQGIRPRLVDANGEAIDLPELLNEFLLDLLKLMETGQSVLLVPESEEYTTQAAGNFLGMSRPYLIRLLEAGKIPYRRVGTHRRIRLHDLMVYSDQRNAERAETLSKMTHELVDANLYDRFTDPSSDLEDNGRAA